MVITRVHVGVLLFVACLTFVLFAPHKTFAQTSAGIGLKPATFEETLDPGTVKTYDLRVSNLKSQEQLFYIYKRNIRGVRTGGVPIFADDDLEETGYELIDWVSFDEEELVLQPNEERTIKFTLTVPEDAAPGSHFGGVFVSADPPRMRTSGAGIGYEVASILSIRVSGEAVEKAMLRSFKTDNYIYSTPNVSFTANIRNDGNVLVRPVGPLEVFNMFGKRVAILTFNESEAGVFPGTDREFEIIWDDDGTGFGRYEAIVSPVFGDSGAKQTISATVSFWILPMNIIAPAAGILAVLLLVTYFGVKLYVRRTVMQMTGGRRLVKQQRRGAQRSSPLLLIVVVMLTVTALFLIVLLLLFS